MPHKHLPPLLKDKYLGNITIDDDGKKYYENLKDVYMLLEMVINEKCELYITPTTLGELDVKWHTEEITFVNKYINVVSVSDEHAEEFYRKRNKLAQEYVNQGAMNDCYNATMRTRTPENDAYIMAEASLCGLVLVTTNNKDFIHYNNFKENYTRADIIHNLNRRFGLNFKSNLPRYTISPYPMTLTTFVIRSKVRKKGYQKPYYTINPQIKDCEYYQQLK